LRERILRDDREFVTRLLKRRPELENELRLRLATSRGSEATEGFASPDAQALETIVSEQRPVFFASADASGRSGIDLNDAAIRGAEAAFLTEELRRHHHRMVPLLDRIGRIDVEGLTGAEFVGTGWIIDDGVVVTNRHVAEVVGRRSASGYSFRLGASGRPVSLQFSTGHLKGDPVAGVSIPVASVLYIEPEGSDVDIAFLKLSAASSFGTLSALPLHSATVGDVTPLCVLGYPGKASARVIPDQQLMHDLYRGVFDVKRVAPGYVARQDREIIAHDCTTLGGN
jgi:hypothetical protein